MRHAEKAIKDQAFAFLDNALLKLQHTDASNNMLA